MRLKDVLGELVDAMDIASPDYKTARKIWAGESRQIRAIETGEELFSLSQEELERRLSKMKTGELAGFRVGAHRAIRKVVEKARDGASVSNNLFGSRDLREKMRLAIGNKAEFDDFSRFMKAQKEQYATRATAQGNSTSIQQGAGMMDAGMDATVQITKEVITQGTLSAGLNAIGRALSKFGGWTEDSAAATARILLSTDSAVQDRILAQLGQQVKAGRVPAHFYRQVMLTMGTQQGTKAAGPSSVPPPPPMPGAPLLAR
jgi:hypothetical protein